MSQAFFGACLLIVEKGARGGYIGQDSKQHVQYIRSPLWLAVFLHSILSPKVSFGGAGEIRNTNSD
ncbi:hypothetical protein CNQ82_05575 [Staphylococcus debuckii]|nr:hypothetical protein CNQ82_05575 [Staphylococcus debuckii]